MSTEINDLVTAAIQKYAADLPNPEFRLNLLAAAEDMAPKLIETLGLKQEWGIVRTERYDVGVDPTSGTEVISEVKDTTENRDQAYNDANWHREMDLKYPGQGYDDDEFSRKYVGTRLFTDWTEEHVLVLTPEEQHQMDIDQGVVSG